MSLTVTYTLMDPAKNLTVLVESPVPADERAAVAERLMAREPAAEQLGFLGDVPDADIGLTMAGGEFCGNATLSAAVWQAKRSGLSEGCVTVCASGAPGPVPVDVAQQSDGSYIATLEMPAPLSVKKEPLPNGGELPVVRFDGISHVILEQDLGKSAAEKLVKQWVAHWGEDALGLLLLDVKRNRLTPLVYVPAAGTLCWERACGSGAAAVGAWLASERGEPIALRLQQPGGVLTIEASPGGPLRLSGPVRCLYRKTIQ